MTPDTAAPDFDPTCGGCVAGVDPWHSHAIPFVLTDAGLHATETVVPTREGEA